jgi:hypothetical protein
MRFAHGEYVLAHVASSMVGGDETVNAVKERGLGRWWKVWRQQKYGDGGWYECRGKLKVAMDCSYMMFVDYIMVVAIKSSYRIPQPATIFFFVDVEAGDGEVAVTKTEAKEWMVAMVEISISSAAAMRF